MFGLGTFEIVVILLVALLILGPKKLPEMVKSIGKGIREFRRSLTEAGQESVSDVRENETEKKDKT